MLLAIQKIVLLCYLLSFCWHQRDNPDRILCKGNLLYWCIFEMCQL